MSDKTISWRKIGPKLVPYLKDYASYHRTKGNQFTHAIGLPVITITTLGMLSHLVLYSPAGAETLFRLDAALILWLLGTLWYLTLDWKVGLPFSLCALGFYFLGRVIPLSWAFGIWVAGWILQFIGHYYYEKKSPAFYKNLTHLLIGPIWLFVKLVGYGK